VVFNLSGVTAVTGNGSGAYALRSDGTVWAWGQSFFTGATQTAVDPTSGGGTPFFATVPKQVLGLADVVAISDSLALRSDGTVWSWGYNYMWRLGNGNTDEHSQATTPVQVSGLTNVVAIAGNAGNGYALKADGTVWSWGQNLQGELGNGTSGAPDSCVDDEEQGVSPDGPNCASAVPVQVSGLSGVTAIGNGLATTSDGRVWRWGPRGGTQDNTPVLVPGLTGVTAFARTWATDYALRSDGTVWAWGQNENGSYGNGTTCPLGDTCYSDTPVQVNGLTATAISAGGTAAYALRADGTVWAWGGGQDGELGDGNLFAQSAVPVQIAGLSGVSAIGDYGYAVVPTP
jgi:alpha-tubulin suppressor-like RCC1 family protein